MRPFNFRFSILIVLLSLFTEGVLAQKFSTIPTARPRNNTKLLGGENDNSRTFTFGELKDSVQIPYPHKVSGLVETNNATELRGKKIFETNGRTSYVDMSGKRWTIDSTVSGGGAGLPTQTGNGGKVLSTDGTNPTWVTAPTGGANTVITEPRFEIASPIRDQNVSLAPYSALNTPLSNTIEAYLTNGGIGDALTRGAIDTLVRCLDYYDLWRKIHVLYPFVGTTAVSQSLNLRAPMPDRSHAAAITWGDELENISGYKPNFSNSGVSFTSGQFQHGRYLWHMKSHDIAITLKSRFGNFNNNIVIATQRSFNGAIVENGLHFAPRKSDGKIYAAIGTDVLPLVGVNTIATTGMFSAQRNTTDSVVYYQNGQYLGKVKSNYKGLPDFSANSVYTYINGQQSIAGNTSADLQFLIAHDTLTAAEYTILYQILQAFDTKLGRQSGTPMNFPRIDGHFGTETPYFYTDSLPYNPLYAATHFGFDAQYAAVKDGCWFHVGDGGGFMRMFKSCNKGRTWTQIADLHPTISPRHAHGFVQLDSFWYIIGADIQNPSNDVWRTKDFINWTKINDNVDWGYRVWMGITTHKGEIYMAGGAQFSGNAYDYGSVVYKRDVWKSKDGITWSQVCASCLPMTDGTTQFPDNLVSLGGKLVIGGSVRDDTSSAARIYNQNYYYSPDDGKTWLLGGKFATKRSYAQAKVWKGKLWTFGGGVAFDFTDGSPQLTSNSCELRYTDDLVNWTNIHIPLHRATHAATYLVDDEKMYILYGNGREKYPSVIDVLPIVEKTSAQFATTENVAAQVASVNNKVVGFATERLITSNTSGNMEAQPLLRFMNTTKRLGIGDSTFAPQAPIHLKTTSPNYLWLEGNGGAIRYGYDGSGYTQYYATTGGFGLYIQESVNFWNYLNTAGQTTIQFNASSTPSIRGTRYVGTVGTNNFQFSSADHSFVSNNANNFGVGTNAPKAKLHIGGGSPYVGDVGEGLIQKSPNGNCWRLTVSDAGAVSFVSITCPN